MPLHIELKAHEKIFIAGAVILNGDNRCQLTILNDVPILREKDIITEADANTPCKRIYLVVQSMYMDESNFTQYQSTYWSLVRDVLQAAPSTLQFITEISQHIAERRYYKALKATQRLITYEKELIDHAVQSS